LDVAASGRERRELPDDEMESNQFIPCIDSMADDKDMHCPLCQEVGEPVAY
jgi:hypothetical protein